jgi:hypothetical protein
MAILTRIGPQKFNIVPCDDTQTCLGNRKTPFFRRKDRLSDSCVPSGSTSSIQKINVLRIGREDRIAIAILETKSGASENGQRR